ncbi:MAG: hypothetical protein ABI151_05865 [Chitinophagaceae bacterium]
MYTRGDGTLLLFLLLVTQNIDRATTKLDGTLSQAAAWFVACQNIEDEKSMVKEENPRKLTPSPRRNLSPLAILI